MRRRDMIPGICFGLVIGLVAALLLGGRTMPRASAQAERANASRYQFKVWSYPGATGERSTYPASHGAYVLDTTTGKLWQATDGGSLKPAGQAN